MKTKLILTLASMLLLVTGMRAATPYAVYCEGDQSFHFLTADSEPTGELNGQTITKVFVVDLNPIYGPSWRLENLKKTVETVVFEESFKGVKPKDCYQWFHNFSSLTKIENLDYLNTSITTRMGAMFLGCSSLTSLDLSNFDTSNVTDMGSMFNRCSSLKDLDVSTFDTSSVTDMSAMFDECSGLTSLDLSGFDTGKATDMSNMFSGCSGLTSLDLSSFDTSNVTEMWQMFYGCNGLTSLDLSSFNTSNVTSMRFMFRGCSTLTSLNLSSFTNPNVTNMYCMFLDCSGLTSLNLSNFGTSNVTDMGSMFKGCSGMTSLNLSSFDTSKVTDMISMFYNCSKLENIYVSDKFTTADVSESENMFEGCTKLKNFKYANVDAQYANYGENGYFTYFGPHAVFDTESNTLMFKNDAAEGSFYLLPEANDEPEWSDNSSDIEKVVFDESFADARPTSCYQWFNGCSNLTAIEGLNNLNTSEVTNMESMFEDCSGLTSLDMSSFNTSNVTNMSSMFRDCSGLTTLDLSRFDTSNVTSMWYMFIDCSSLTSLDLSRFNTSKVTNMFFMFQGCNNLTTLYLTHFDFSLFTTIDPGEAYLFSQCNNLRLVDLSESEASSNLKSTFPQNALIYVPEGTEVADGIANVVVGETCAHFVINYGDTENNQNLLNIPYKFTADKVTINRKFEKDIPYSLYLPFALSSTDFGQFFTYAGYTESTVKFEPVTGTTTANTPYMLLPADDYANGIVIEGSVTVETTPENVGTDNDGYVGVYEKKTFTEEEVNSGLYYGWAGTDFHRAGNGASVDACRAYLKLPSNAAFKAPARMDAKFGDNGTTGISDINSDESAADSPSYNLNGQRVSDSYRGIVVKEGRKIINQGL